VATLAQIESITKDYAIARKLLEDRLQELNDEIAQAKKRNLNAIKKMVNVAATYQSRLHAAIEESPELFRKPRTIVLNGIKVGFMKGKGEIQWEDAAQVVKLIKKHFPDQAETLIRVSESPVKSALTQLPVQDLRRLGVEVIDTGDLIVIKPTDSEVDRMVDALLRDEMKDVQEAA
jgi:hypothetical protein